MKAIQILLVLCLLAALTCSTDFKTFIFCLIGNPDCAEIISTLINKIIEGENILSIGMYIAGKAGKLIGAVTNCLK